MDVKIDVENGTVAIAHPTGSVALTFHELAMLNGVIAGLVMEHEKSKQVPA